MRKVTYLLLGALLATAVGALAATGSKLGAQLFDLYTLISCEDETNTVCRVEQQFSYKGNLAADTSVKSTAGFVHSVSCAGTDGTATAGSVILYDNAAESGTKIWEWDVAAVAVTTPFTVILDAVAATGLYLGFTTTADVNCTVSYR